MTRHKVFNRSVRILPAVTLLLVAACSSAPPTTVATTPAGPTAGWLTVQLVTPRTDDGAVQISILGPAIDSVAIVTYDGFGALTGAQADLVATGAITSGTVARIFVPDVSLSPAYQATVSAAAARDSYLLQPLDGYRAVVVR